MTIYRAVLSYTIIHVFCADIPHRHCKSMKKDGTNHAAIIDGYRAVTIQCRWNLTSIADQNNDTRLRNHESIAELISNSWGMKRAMPTPLCIISNISIAFFHPIITLSRRDEKCFCRTSGTLLPTTKGKTGHEIDIRRIVGYKCGKVLQWGG